MTINEFNLEIDTDKIIKDLRRLIRIPSVSAKSQKLEECAKEVLKIMQEIGIQSELIYFDKDNNTNTVPPLVYGEIKSKSNPNGKTILFYNHYDVQPEEPIDLWDHDPFGGIIKENRIFGRGSSDDKGELITRLNAVEYLLKHTGDVPINVKFLVEGQEEIGSNNISEYIDKYKSKFKTDLVIWEFGYIDQWDHPIISLGMKGLLYVELTAIGPSRDVHSSLAVLIENPAWKLIRALFTLFDNRGKILVEDWYKEIKKLTKDEIVVIENEPFDTESFKKEYGIDKFVNNTNEKYINHLLVNEPTCNIAGLISGYTGEGAKTIIPSRASAKIDFRLVPDMDPIIQFKRLKKHLEKNGFGDIQVTCINGVASGRTDINNMYIKPIQESANSIFGDSMISISSAGTGPMYEFIKLLKAPCISIGGTYIFARIHSPNEYARIDLLEKTTKCIITIINNISKL